MKQLPLSNSAFVTAETGFKEWLDILGYAAITVYNLPHAVREFLHWLEVREFTGLHNITGELLSNYYAYLKNRPNIKRDGGLSNAYLNKHQQAIKKFSEYLHHTPKLAQVND
ncbi:MAG: hypothetical protein JST75_21580 [Bacteroidetes bacterium]|nr:hypothetical protein [Bacteroidota bacterium]